jgi:hypothetical protein
MTLAPRHGFNWQAVSWGGPDEPVAEECSYCDAPIPDDGVPLILWNEEGWCARFCDACQERWWGMTVPEPFDDDYGEADSLSLGPCCGCERDTGPARNIVMLRFRNKMPGHGWGCFVCHLPTDGAAAVLCDDCADRMERGEDVIRFACRGYPSDEGRAPIGEFTEPFDHDPNVDHS